MVGLIGCADDPPLVEIGGERVVAGAGKAVGDAANLVVQAPPFLDDHDAGPVIPGARHIAFGLATVGTRKFDHVAHGSSPLSVVRWKKRCGSAGGNANQISVTSGPRGQSR